MLAFVVAAALVSGTGPLPAGATDLTVLAGRPFYSVRVAHGITDRLDLGVGVDVSPVAGLFRPLGQVRLRLWSNEAVQVALRGLVAGILARPNAEGYGPRSVARTADGELGLGVDWAFAPRFGVFAELSALGETDLKAEHSATFAQALVGLEWQTGGPISLIARGGVLQGSRGRASIGSAGVAFRF
jgi:hypothetical protein